jgi:hypothetical protein
LKRFINSVKPLNKIYPVVWVKVDPFEGGDPCIFVLQCIKANPYKIPLVYDSKLEPDFVKQATFVFLVSSSNRLVIGLIDCTCVTLL